MEKEGYLMVTIAPVLKRNVILLLYTYACAYKWVYYRQTCMLLYNDKI